MNKEERLKTKVKTYLQKREVEKKANEVLKKLMKRMLQVYENQYRTNKTSIAVFEDAIIEIMRKNCKTCLKVYAKLLVASEIRKIMLQGFKKDDVERFYTLVNNLADSSERRCTYKGNTNESYVLKYKKFSETAGAT